MGNLKTKIKCSPNLSISTTPKSLFSQTERLHTNNFNQSLTLMTNSKWSKIPMTKYHNSLMVTKAADFDKLQADITDTTLHRTQDPSKIGKKNAKRCADLEKTAYTNPKFVEKSKKGEAFRMKVQLEIEELKCYAHMGL